MTSCAPQSSAGSHPRQTLGSPRIIWWFLSHESLHSAGLWLYGNGVSRLEVGWGGSGRIPVKTLGKQLAGVSTGLRLLPVLHPLEMQKVNFKAFIHILYLFTSPHPERARHSASFWDYNADQDRCGPCSDGPLPAAAETASIPYQMVV